MGLDVALFRLVNRHSANPLFDAIFPWLTRGEVMQAMLLILGGVVVLLAYRQGDRAAVRLAWTTVAVALATVVLNEWLGSGLLKDWFARPRPPRTLPDVRLLVGLGQSFSFPSSHAANAVGVTCVVARAWPRWTPYLAAYALLITYSRVYVGVHYPLDVLGGALLGLGIGTGLWHAVARWQERRG